MKEFMLLIRNEIDSKEQFSAEKHREFLKACEVYIENLKNNNNLISAQPMAREGVMISHPHGDWVSGNFNEAREVIVGYYHIVTTDLDAAIAIAKGNPEFAYTTTARIEVRPIKMKEESTLYVYPTA